MSNKCRDCRHWEREWYSEEWDQWCGYGCHLIDGKNIDIGICLLAPRDSRVRLEDRDACDDFEKVESAVGDDIENLLFGE